MRVPWNKPRGAFIEQLMMDERNANLENNGDLFLRNSAFVRRLEYGCSSRRTATEGKCLRKLPQGLQCDYAQKTSGCRQRRSLSNLSCPGSGSQRTDKVLSRRSQSASGRKDQTGMRRLSCALTPFLSLFLPLIPGVENTPGILAAFGSIR